MKIAFIFLAIAIISAIVYVIADYISSQRAQEICSALNEIFNTDIYTTEGDNYGNN